MTRKRQEKVFYWTVAIIMEIGAWLLHQCTNYYTWDLLSPNNLGSLIVAVCGALIATLPYQQRHDTSKRKNERTSNSRSIH